MTVTDERWSCPRCGDTTTVIGSRLDCSVALAAVREHHRCGHRPPATTEPMRAIHGRARPIPPIPNHRRTEP